MLLLLLSSALALGLAGSADLVSTELALRHSNLAEANPFMQSRAARIGVKAAMAGSVYAVSKELEKRGKKRAAKVVIWTVVGMWAGAAAWNTYQMRRHRDE